MEKMITADIASQVKELFADMLSPVEIVFFTKDEECPYCYEIEQLVGEVVELSDLIGVQVHQLAAQQELAAQYHVIEAPVVVILARNGEEITDYGVRFLGAPAGHEFTSFIHSLLYVSRRSTDLSEETRSYLQALTEPLLLQVFVTPT